MSGGLASFSSGQGWYSSSVKEGITWIFPINEIIATNGAITKAGTWVNTIDELSIGNFFVTNSTKAQNDCMPVKLNFNIGKQYKLLIVYHTGSDCGILNLNHAIGSDAIDIVNVDTYAAAPTYNNVAISSTFTCTTSLTNLNGIYTTSKNAGSTGYRLKIAAIGIIPQ